MLTLTSLAQVEFGLEGIMKTFCGDCLIMDEDIAPSTAAGLKTVSDLMIYAS